MAVVSDPRPAEAAIDWLIRQRDSAFADWESFTDWLEADPANADAYAQLATRDEELAQRLSRTPLADEVAPATEVEADQDRTRRFSRRAALGGIAAIAASLALAFGTFQLRPQESLYRVATAPGVQQTVVLAGGTSVTLNGATSLSLDRNDPRFALLERGEAKFAVVHDASNPFRVHVGGAELVDLGTVFNVVRQDGVTEVGVAEGVVMYNPDAEAIRLPPGRALKAAENGSIITISTVAPLAVGSWQEGRLIYQDEPLAEVARDLSRSIGTPVTADPDLASRRVTAVVQIPKDRDQLAGRLERLLDITVRQTEQGWILTKSG